MLSDFVDANRDAIIARTRERVTARVWPTPSAHELENGVPLFLTQLSATLRLQTAGAPFSGSAIESSAARHGGHLLALGFTVSQVVQDYGDICQAITELAIEQNAPIATDEFHTLNHCLDTAIAEAVTEYSRLTAQSRSTKELERFGQLAHEIRDMLSAALLAFHALKRGTVAINGSTGAVLGRSLIGLRDLVDSTLSDIRMSANHQRPQRIKVSEFVNDMGATGTLHAEYRGLQFSIDPVDDTLAVDGDVQLLSSAVTNLLNNAFKYTRNGGNIHLRAHRVADRLRIEVEDECGGISDAKGDPFGAFADRRGHDRTGLGLGLSIAQKAIRSHGGEIEITNIPGHGCIFVIDLPLAAEVVTS